MIEQVKGVPAGASAIIPRLYCRDPLAELEFCTATFAAVERVRRQVVVLYVYVEDADETVERAVSAGARMLMPLTDQVWGDRTAWIIDPSGHVWTIATRVEETTEAQRKARLEQMHAKSAREPAEGSAGG